MGATSSKTNFIESGMKLFINLEFGINKNSFSLLTWKVATVMLAGSVEL